MKLYWISQDERRTPQAYFEAVVVAESETDARTIHPSGVHRFEKGRWVHPEKPFADDKKWASHPEEVDVLFLGWAMEGLERGVICANLYYQNT